MSIDYIVKDEMRLTVMGDLLIMLNRHFVVVRSRGRLGVLVEKSLDQGRDFAIFFQRGAILCVGHVLWLGDLSSLELNTAIR